MGEEIQVLSLNIVRVASHHKLNGDDGKENTASGEGNSFDGLHNLRAAGESSLSWGKSLGIKGVGEIDNSYDGNNLNVSIRDIRGAGPATGNLPRFQSRDCFGGIKTCKVYIMVRERGGLCVHSPY